MKVKHVFAVYFTGVIVQTIGGLFKIMSWESADLLLTLSTAIIVLSYILAIWKVMTTRELKDFLNI